MALEPDRALPSATTGRDGGDGPRGSAEDGVQQVQRDDRVKAHKRRLAIENAAFLELAHMLPVRSSTSGFVDKPTVLRHAIAFMKVSRFYRRDLPQPPRSCGASQWETTETLTDALSGFVFMLDGNGWILYMSNSVSRHLGHSAVEMMGNNIRNYLHDDDMAVLSNLLRLPVRGLTDRGEPCQMLLRVTNSLRKWRPSCKSGCSRYAVVLCSGYRSLCQLTEAPISEDNRSSNILLLAIGYTLPHSYLPQCELETGSGMPVRSSLTFLGQRCFMFRSSLGLTPFYVEAAVKELTGYETFTFSRCSLYHFVHPCDIESVRRSHNDVLAKGHSVTGYYRLIVRSGGWIWMQSYFSLVHAASTTRKKFILAVNYAISGVENSRLGSHDVSYPNHFLSLRKGPEISDRGKAMELCRREGKTPLKSTPKNVKCYGNSDQNAILGSAGIPQNNDHNTALAYNCADSNFMKSLAARESVRNEQTHTLWSQPQRESDGIRSNASAGRISVNTAGLSGGVVKDRVEVHPVDEKTVGFGQIGAIIDDGVQRPQQLVDLLADVFDTESPSEPLVHVDAEVSYGDMSLEFCAVKSELAARNSIRRGEDDSLHPPD
ncbi:single-minded homolog 2-like [Schistocerca cancellata]|uniref:single-minded homolog 2-like n=1 Tax=Schistocerca cancellata TaxID=274614 RepID=UPI002117CF37|nr:single-minded homolog 2-like [Schistocerca cancellata]